MKVDVGTQTEKPIQKLLKLDSFGKLKFDRYYFDPNTEKIVTIRDGKNGRIRKELKSTLTTGNKFIIVLVDSENKSRTINYKNLIEYCKELAESENL